MRIFIRAPHIPSTDTVRSYVSKRVKQHFEYVEDRVETVSVRLEDVNGPKGGVDKLCQIVATCGRLGTMHVEAKEATLREAIDAAVDKAHRAVAHAVEKKVTTRRARAPHRRAAR